MLTLSKKIKVLQEEIRAMQDCSGALTVDPLDQVSYGDKVRELMKLRRQQIRKGKKDRDTI